MCQTSESSFEISHHYKGVFGEWVQLGRISHLLPPLSHRLALMPPFKYEGITWQGDSSRHSEGNIKRTAERDQNS